MAHLRNARQGIEPPVVGEYCREKAEIEGLSIVEADRPAPEPWTYTTLGEVAEIKGGKRLPMGAKLVDERTDFPYIRVTDFSGFSVDTTSIRYLTPEVQKRIGNYIITKDDVFISIAGTIGRVGTIPEELDGANLTENAARIVLRNKNVEKEFLKYCLAGPEVQSEILSRRSKNAQPKLALVQIKALRIPLPPLDEQKKIAHVLSTVQRAIEAQERIIQTTTELKKALMHKLFTEGLHNEPRKQTEIGPVPESWDVVPLGKLAKLSSGGTPSRKNSEYWLGGNIPWVKTGEIDYGTIHVTEELITEAGLANSSAKVFGSGTLLMAMYGEGVTRGRVARLGIDAATNQACAAILPFNENLSSSSYLYYYFEYRYEQLRQLGHGANQKNLSATVLNLFPVVLPSSRDQADSVSLLLAIDQKLFLARKKRIGLQVLFRCLLRNLMSADIRA